jgi:hypothetical protein
LGDLYRTKGTYSYTHERNWFVKAGVSLVFAGFGWFFVRQFVSSYTDNIPGFLSVILKTSIIVGFYFLGSLVTKDSGWNWRAVAATLIGCFVAWIGVFVPALRPLYDYAWFVGFGSAALAYLLAMKLAPPKSELQSEAS